MAGCLPDSRKNLAMMFMKLGECQNMFSIFRTIQKFFNGEKITLDDKRYFRKKDKFLLCVLSEIISKVYPSSKLQIVYFLLHKIYYKLRYKIIQTCLLI